MVRTSPNTRRCRVRLNPLTFQRSVRQTVVELYGSKPYGQRPYSFESTAVTSLREAAEEFLEKMWDQVKDITRHNNRSTVVGKDFEDWKRANNFIRPQKRRSLLKMLESEEEKNKRVRRCYRSCVKSSDKDPLFMTVHQTFFQQLKDGEKTVESRPYYPSYRSYSVGDYIMFQTGTEILCLRIEQKHVYPDFKTMLRNEDVRECLPDHVGDLLDAEKTYHSFRNGSYERLAEKYGVVSFRLSYD